MRISAGLGLALLLSTAAVAQSRGGSFNPQPTFQGGFGNVVFPAGVPTGNQRIFGNVVFPAGGGPHLNVPLSNPSAQLPAFGVANRGPSVGQRRSRSSSYFGVPYAVPVYGGGYGYGSYYDNPYSPDGAAPAAQQPNIIVIYPPAPQPVVVDRSAALAAQPQTNFVQPYEEPASAVEASHFLIAFKDHTIYSAVAYWVDGDTLHYFTSGNTHNQVSLSLVDRDLTERLNRESGSDVRLPR